MIAQGSHQWGFFISSSSVPHCGKWREGKEESWTQQTRRLMRGICIPFKHQPLLQKAEEIAHWHYQLPPLAFPFLLLQCSRQLKLHQPASRLTTPSLLHTNRLSAAARTDGANRALPCFICSFCCQWHPGSLAS